MKKALVADDTRNIRNLLTTCLELKGYEVRTAKNGMEAMDWIEKESFEIAFIDVRMPEISGTEVLRRLRRMGRNFPVVIMTAYGNIKNAVECMKLGACTYLLKPFKVDKIEGILFSLGAGAGAGEGNSEHALAALISDSRKLIGSTNTAEALKLLQQGLSMDSSAGELYFLIGKIHQMKNEPEHAEKFYHTARLFGYDEDGIG